MENWQFYVPTHIHCGWGEFGKIETYVEMLNGRKIFLVTGKGFTIRTGLAERLATHMPGKTIVAFAEI